jgi:hypothetical protein
MQGGKSGSPHGHVVLQAIVVRHFFREKKDAHKKKKDRIDRDEQVKRERPLPNALQTVFPSPEMDQVQEQKKSPQEMHQ